MDTKAATPSEFARGLDAAAMQLHQLLHEREADPGTLLRASLRRLDSIEALEQAWDFLVRYPDAGVGYLQRDPGAVALQTHGDLAEERELEGVRQQVEDDFLPHLPVQEQRLTDGSHSTRKARPAASIAERKELAR